ncbi:response regulator [Candidatus Dojkabacteria bacterium]|nr:response regulator [Candidatus Dojkabacteria bacterium]
MAEEKKTILIMEDEEALLESYAEILEAQGWKVLKAPDGYKGMQALIDNKPKVDLVLLDLMMPGIDGLEVLRNIKDNPDKYGEMPVIVLTAMVSDKVIKEAYEIGAKSYLIKSELNSEDIVNEIKRVMLG